jgi:putative phosphoesterase
MTTIGVISDTHIKQGGKRQIPPQVYETFAGVDLILHAGDLNTMQVITDLEAIAPVVAVYGNNCDWEVLHTLTQTREMKIEDVRIGLVHGDIGKGSSTRLVALSHFPNVDCVVFGHSHRPLIDWYDLPGGRGDVRQVLLFNPGSATKKRGAPHHSCGILRIDRGRIEPQLFTW